MNFADYLSTSIEQHGSLLCAGLDLRPADIPAVFHDSSKEGEQRIEKTVTNYYLSSLEVLAPHICCIKPNIAFFEQFGFGALRALQKVCKRAKELHLPVILDGKRGDIGSTNQAYADAYLNSRTGDTSIFSGHEPLLFADALTVNPFLGLDSMLPFLQTAKASGRGVFLLVRTSNPDAAALQSAQNESGLSLSEQVASWIKHHAQELTGRSGLSGLGAVVGATKPEDAVKLRTLMPKSIFLVPGYGAQGGSAKDALSGAIPEADLKGAGLIVNSSRGLFGIEGAKGLREADFLSQLSKRALTAKNELALAKKC